MHLATRPTLCMALTASVLCVAGIAHAQSDTPSDPLDVLWERVIEKLNQASDALEPPLAPPEPVAIRWQARRISSIDLGAPLLALASGDLDGDAKAEILTLTTRELFIVDRQGRRKLTIRARIQIPGPKAPIRPRSPVGSIVVSDTDADGVPDITVRSSAHARSVTFGYRDGALFEKRRVDGFRMCPAVSAELDAGRHEFTSVTLVEPTPKPKTPTNGEHAPSDTVAPTATLPGRIPLHAIAFGADRPPRFLSARCRDDMVDTIGRQLSVIGIVASDRKLHLWSGKRCPRRALACHEHRVSTRKIGGKGVAFELGDVDRDGYPEVIVSAASPPGQPDHLTVLSWRKKRMRQLFKRTFSGGVVGVTAGDIDGDGILNVFAAVRLLGSHRVDMWVFN